MKLGWLTVACASVVDVMAIGGVSINTNLPLLPLQNFGTVGSGDGGALLRHRDHVLHSEVLAGSGPTARLSWHSSRSLGAVVLANQRAVLVNVAIVVAVLVLVPLFGHRKSVIPGVCTSRRAMCCWLLLAIIAVVIAVVVVPAAVDQKPVRIPLATTFQNLFHSEGKAESAQDRLNLAAEAEKLIPHHPIIGWGLGVEFPFYEAGTTAVQQTAYAHDIALDLWLRLGLIGFSCSFSLSWLRS